MIDDQDGRRLLPGKEAKIREMEASALKLVTDQQTRIRNAAKVAFQEDHDPMRRFAEIVSYSSVAHVEAMILLQKADVERMRLRGHNPVSSGTAAQTVTVPPFFTLFGIVPADPIRFRIVAFFVAITVLLAVFGLGVLVAKA